MLIMMIKRMIRIMVGEGIANLQWWGFERRPFSCWRWWWALQQNTILKANCLKPRSSASYILKDIFYSHDRKISKQSQFQIENISSEQLQQVSILKPHFQKSTVILINDHITSHDYPNHDQHLNVQELNTIIANYQQEKARKAQEANSGEQSQRFIISVWILAFICEGLCSTSWHYEQP